MDGGITPELLAELKRGMLLTGKIPEPIFKSLQFLPFIVLDEVDSVEIDYDLNFNGLSESKFSYKIKKKLDVTEQDEQRKDAIVKMVKGLLWDEVNVSIQFVKEG